MHACTIVARNYLAQAQVLVDSFRTHHPDGTFHVLLVDDPAAERPVMDGAEVVMLDEIGIEAKDLGQMVAIYELIELATAAKPFLLLALLDRGFDHAVYFDPDISIERRIDDLPALARQHSIVLTPHLTEPMPRDGGQPSEQSLLLSGTYNLGFLAVGDTSEARSMLTWWGTRLVTDSIVDVARGFFTDQRLMDFVPGLFPHMIVDDPSWNVAYWNLATRPLSRTDDGQLLVAGRPATFIHYSGYSPKLPHLLSKHQGARPRIKLSEHGLLRELCDDYGARLLAHGFTARQADFTPPFSTLQGVTLDELTRRLVRSELAAVAQGERSDLKLAHHDGLPLGEWLDRPARNGRFPWLGRYLEALYLSRPDVRRSFPGVRTGKIGPFLHWVETHGIPEAKVPRERLDNARHASRQTSTLLSRDADPVSGSTSHRGVEVAGYLNADLGLGESARQFVASLQAAGVPASTTSYRRTQSRLAAPWTDVLPQPGERHDISLTCINADQLPRFRKDAGPSYFRGRYRIGLWFWEVDDFPAHMRRSARFLDEIWVCSEFNRAAIAPHVDIPVTVVPHPAHSPSPSDASIPETPADDVFTFLFVFDYLSVFERKNPAGLVEAFTRAYPVPGRTRLVIKAINGDKAQNDRERLRYLVGERPDIVLVERYLTRPELDYLMQRADCYVSLHRSEGFGQTLAEMMAIGKPVIATAYSGNLEFTRPDNAFLVPYVMVRVAEGSGPYPTTASWADPDLDEAARLMELVRTDESLRSERAAEAAATIRREFSTDALAGVAGKRLAEIWDSPAYRERLRTAEPTPEHQASSSSVARKAVAKARRVVGRS